MKLYKFRSMSNLDYILDILINQQLYCCPYYELNDPFEGMLNIRMSEQTFQSRPIDLNKELQIATRKKKVIFNLTVNEHKQPSSVSQYFGEDSPINIVSLCSSMSDVRMWSLYANSFTGVAIEIEVDINDPNLHPVKYKKSIPEINLDDPSERIQPIHVLTNKTEQWDYESEYRIITNDDFYSIAGKIMKVYFGYRMTEKHKNLLLKLLPNVPTVETILDYENVIVKPKPEEE